MWLLVLGFIFGVGLAYALSQIKRKPKFLSINEFWVYLPSDTMPAQDAVMDRLLQQNPYRAISPREGLLMSDIRLHIALMLRSKNPHIFRPDLFAGHVQPTAEVLTALSGSQSAVKVRYISEQPLKDRANIQLLPHLAEAYAELAGGTVIYDRTKEELLTLRELKEALKSHRDITTLEDQVRVIWQIDGQGGRAETRGLRKVGLPELSTQIMEADEEVLVMEVLCEAAKKLWEVGSPSDVVEVVVFGDIFRIEIELPKEQVSKVKILRLQTV